MKRVAEKQISKDQDGDEDDEVEEVSTGFKKADESVLAKRPMRALPRRSFVPNASNAPPAASAPTPEPPAAGKFSGFSGFGSGAPSTPFSFSTPPAAPKLAPAFTVAAPPSFPSSALSLPSSMFGSSVLSSASPATKAFASIVSSSSASTESIPSSDIPEDQSELEYYKAIRGLNVSFLSAVSKAIESDPFVDVAELLVRYKFLRISAESDLNVRSKGSHSTSTPTFTSSKPAEVPKPSAVRNFFMPTPPSTFAGFKPPVSSSSVTSSAPASGGFTPKLNSNSASLLNNPFTFGSPKPAAHETGSTETPKASFTFGSSSSSSGTPSSPFTFGPPSSSGSSLFGKGGTSSSPSSSSIFGSSSSPFGSSFGKPSDADSAKEGDKGKEADKPALNSTSLVGSGGLTLNPFGGSPITPDKEKEKEKDQSSAPFFFGSASPSRPSLFGGFGAKAGSIGNPVGFGFGSPPKTPELEDGNGPSKSLPFSFGAPKPFAVATEKEQGESAESASSGEGTPAPDQQAPLLAAASVHDAEGEGEEDEETTHQIRCKVYKMGKDKVGEKGQWNDCGVGMLRMKKHKTTDARRVLLRNSNTGKITINFLMHSGMRVTAADKVVSFIGHEEAVSVPYRIRTKSTEQANELKAAFDREIAFVKSKSGE